MMKKFLPGVLLIFFGLTLWPVSVSAEVLWQIELRDDGSVHESLTVDRALGFNNREWTLSGGEGKYELKRKLDNWQAYQASSQSLPIASEVKNHLIFKKISLFWEKDKPSGFFHQVEDLGAGELIIRVPGYIGESSGEIEEMSVTWKLGQLSTMEDGQKLLTAIVLDGLILGVTLFGVGFLIIIIWLLRRLKQVDKLIADRYSPENAGREVQDEDDDW